MVDASMLLPNLISFLELIAPILGIAGFTLSAGLSFIKILEYRESMQNIDIDVYAIGSNVRKRRDEELSHHYGDQSEQLPEDIFQIYLNFSLANRSSRPIGVKYIRVVWEEPKIIKSFPNPKHEYCLVGNATSLAVNSLSEPFELGNVPKTFDWVLEPSAFLTIDIAKKMKDMKKKMEAGELKSIPFKLKIVVTTNKRKTICKEVGFSLPVV